MKKRILRKGAIVALALVLMFNTLGVSASTAGDEERIPDITVSNYEELVRAFTEQRSGSLIGVTGTIKPFQSWSIKTGQQHIKNDKNIYFHILFEIVNYAVSCIFVVAVI